MREKVAKILYAVAIAVPAIAFTTYVWLSRELVAEYRVTEPFNTGFQVGLLLLTFPVFLLAVALKRNRHAIVIYAAICLMEVGFILAFPPKFGVP
ncbi:hypothetical protein D0B54_17885 [Solimonas sp. K1W22B-7]|uniref:hypothetical protein n=1 Tax=Solimonas sp. K1W22B-7 TaxID=2303331 RepID=UPI000E335E97|nr:hypothetical protein [Solimonas sp. K1W22B-7]AXQ30431.1 hypothetical protein D0B54_17885 [Solimonas sp. K1W22B-7]